MIYAIHKTTKEHRVAPEFEVYPTPGWRYVPADADGWIEWQDEECPLPDDSRCDTRSSYMSIVVENRDPKTVDWRLVRLYRPVLDADSEPEAPEWDGKGLPPVGCECEMNTRDGWVRVTIVYNDGDIAIGRIHDGQDTPSKCDWSREGFRPIRSEEDKAVEEIFQIIYKCDEYRDAARALYRAGYRKLENAS